jgi:hypothetical protein
MQSVFKIGRNDHKFGFSERLEQGWAWKKEAVHSLSRGAKNIQHLSKATADTAKIFCPSD